jgi:hypothetical protein
MLAVAVRTALTQLAAVAVAVVLLAAMVTADQALAETAALACCHQFRGHLHITLVVAVVELIPEAVLVDLVAAEVAGLVHLALLALQAQQILVVAAVAVGT